MAEQPIWVSEADAANLLSLDDAMETLAAAYRLEAAGQAASMRRAHAREGESILHAVGGTIAGSGLTGTKTWTYTPRGAAPLIILFSLGDGRVLGVIEAFAVGELRTAATTGLGTRLLARRDSRTLALLGTGKQAFPQAQAVALTRPIETIRLFGRNAERRAGMARRLADELGLKVMLFDSAAEAAAGADIVTAITRSSEPVVTGGDLRDGMHVNAIGAIVPGRRELDDTAVARAGVIVADSSAQARDDAGELRAAHAAGLLSWADVRSLSDVIDRELTDLRRDTDVTLFKALGVGLADVALGAEVLRRARLDGLGHPLPASFAGH
jgi:alanine dehydrogenase